MSRVYRSRFGAKGKYNSTPTTYRDERYDSKLEASRAAELDILLAAGEITSWERGRRWVLVAPCARPDGKRDRAITYQPDFEVHRGDEFWCEDTKGRDPPAWRLKLRLWWRVYPNTPLWIVRADGTRSLT